MVALEVLETGVVAVEDCKEMRRTKAIEARKKLYMETLKERAEKKEKQKELVQVEEQQPVKPLAAIKEKDEKEEKGSSRRSNCPEHLIEVVVRGGCGANGGI